MFVERLCSKCCGLVSINISKKVIIQHKQSADLVPVCKSSAGSDLLQNGQNQLSIVGVGQASGHNV